MNAAVQPEQHNKLGAFPFVLGGISFVPLLGIPFGIVAIIWGLATSKRGGKKLALIGTGVILLTFILYGTLFYVGFVQRGGIYDELRGKLAQAQLNQLVPAIELYKVQDGKYPESLEVLKASLPKDNLVSVYDPARGMNKPELFFYQQVGADHYYLRAVGPDGNPFTADDILPEITPSANGKLGLLTARQ